MNQESTTAPKSRRISPGEYEALAREAALDMSDGTADLVMTSLIFNLMRASNRIVRDFEVAVYNTAELSWAGYQLLYTLKSIGPTHPKSLARIAGVSTASMSSLLNTMTKKGLVHRQPDPDDGRRQIISLTTGGETILQVMYRENQDREEAWGEALTRDEAEQMVGLLQKMLLHRPRPHRRA
ncbi:MAG: MarR family winged helix-turn-helix transcriptional regulator [Gulosibacter sp.]|uniref:MarR family winged helix-turn-helix transcriptional regulator n=1 Tax=Gulosibacter sp. TaxID=2817531 RepID=UPI003F91FFFC